VTAQWTVSNALHTAIPVPPSASKESVGEQASKIVIRITTLARECGRSGFWGAYSRLLALFARLALNWSSSSSPAPFEGLHCVHLPATTAYDYIEHTHEMSRVNEVTDALSIGPSAGHTLFLVFVHILLLLTAYVISGTHIHIHVVTNITVIFWIKLKLKMPINLTMRWWWINSFIPQTKQKCRSKKMMDQLIPQTKHPIYS
jgi:hypothetical protein